MISVGGTFMASTVCSNIPAAKPRQPAWAAATTVPARSHNNTGKQSAVITAQAACPVLSTLASAVAGKVKLDTACTTSGLCT